MPLLQGEEVAQAIKKHQVSESSPWVYRDLLKELHSWVDRIDKDSNLGVPTPVIAIDGLRINVLGMYRLGRNNVGARTTITFNECWLPYQSLTEILITLTHELLHAYEEWRLGREQGGWYHTVAWRERMAEIGIVADERGHTVRVLSTFYEYLARYGISEARLVPRPRREGPKKRRQMPKWICGCPRENPARAIRLRARCLDCGLVYRKVDS